MKLLVTTLLLFLASAMTETVDIVIVTDLDQGKIFSGPIDPLRELVEIPLQNLSRPTAVDYDPTDDSVYWTDPDHQSINRAFLNGSNQEMVIMLSPTSEPDGIALDIDRRLVYWTDNGTNSIERAQLDGNGRQHIVTTNLNKPRAIVVDSVASRLYWTDWGDEPKIERANTDGTERTTLVDTDLQWPNGLAIDLEGQRLYWCDAGLDSIEYINLDGTHRSGNIFTLSNEIHPFDIAVYKDSVYWTDWKFSKLVEMNKGGSENPNTVGSTLFQQAGGLHIYQKQDTTSPTIRSTSTIAPTTMSAYPSSSKTSKLLSLSTSLTRSTPSTTLEMILSTKITASTDVQSSCSHPGDVENGNSSPSHQDFVPGDEVTYICDESFELIGAKEIICLVNSSWSDSKPTCSITAIGPKSTNLNAVGGIVGIVAGVLLIVIVIWIVVALRQNKRDRTRPNHLLSNHVKAINDDIYLAPTAQDLYNKHSYDELKDVPASDDYITNPTYESISETSNDDQERKLSNGTNLVNDDGYCAMGNTSKSPTKRSGSLPNTVGEITENTRGLDQSDYVLPHPKVNQQSDDYVLPCLKLNQIAIPNNEEDNMFLLEKWRDILNNPNVVKYLKPILTSDYLHYFTDVTETDREEIISNYKYNSPHKAGAAFIDKLSRMELASANQLMRALCECGQHSVHLYLYDLLMAPASHDEDIPGNVVQDSTDSSNNLLEDSNIRIWREIVKDYINDLRTLPYSNIFNKLEPLLQDFLRDFADELENERHNKGDTRAVEWLIREVMVTDTKWPTALIEVLQMHNNVLLSKIQQEFEVKNKEVAENNSFM